MAEWTILCDFDGTVSVEDITDSLLERFGRPGWQAIEQAWRRGEIGSRECMSDQVALLEMTRAELDAHLDGLSIDRAFALFVTATRAAGIPLKIVSDGLDYAIRRILGHCGLRDLPIVANRLVANGGDRWKLEFPYGDADCRSGNCKCTCAGPRAPRQRKILLIGDGNSDFCVAGKVDFVFAKHRLIEHCRAAGIPYVPITGFADAIEWLPALLSGEITPHEVRFAQALPLLSA